MDPTPSFTPLTAALLDPLPSIVQRYLRMALPHGIPVTSRLAFNQRGEIRLKEGTQHWYPFTASQQLNLDPPELIWRARVRLAPLVTATAVDEYLNGIGAMDARLWGIIPLVHTQPEPRLDEGALIRYLAEAAWFPAALLPSERLRWVVAGSDSAMAILRDGTTEARLTFRFNADGEIVHVEGLRPFQSGRNYLSRGWSGLFSEWREHCGMRIPVHARVFWRIDSGLWEYWRGSIETVTCADSKK